MKIFIGLPILLIIIAIKLHLKSEKTSSLVQRSLCKLYGLKERPLCAAKYHKKGTLPTNTSSVFASNFFETNLCKKIPVVFCSTWWYIHNLTKIVIITRHFQIQMCFFDRKTLRKISQNRDELC